MASLHAAGNLVDELSSTVVLADLWRVAGRPSKARRLYERALQRAEAQGERFARAAADLHVGLARSISRSEIWRVPGDTSRPPPLLENGPG